MIKLALKDFFKWGEKEMKPASVYNVHDPIKSLKFQKPKGESAKKCFFFSFYYKILSFIL